MGVADAILARSPSSYWKLDEASGDSFTDEVGGITGTKGADPPTSGQSPVTPGDTTGKSVLFSNATGGAISFGDVYNFSGNQSYTLLAWVRPAVYNNATGHYFWAAQDNGVKGYALFLAGSMLWVMRRGNDAGFEEIYYTMDEGFYENGQPKLFAWVYDGTDSVFNVNGVEVKREASPLSMTVPSTGGWTTLAFGGHNAGGARFDGYGDDLAVFTYALTEAQLREIYWAWTSAKVAWTVA